VPVSEYLISRDTEGDTQLLRFRRDDEVRRSLEGIIAAEGKCCAFLDMKIREEADELVLTIDAPADAAPVAAQLAAAFATP
jgi:hypothetical protein